MSFYHNILRQAAGLGLASLLSTACSVVLDSHPQARDGDAGDNESDAADTDLEVDLDAPDLDLDLDLDAEEDLEISPLCGNSTLDDGEDCDDGNDVDGDGCDGDCTFSCTAAMEETDCDDGHGCTADTCDTDTHQCEHVVLEAGFPCRPARALCDTGELCDGTSQDCPGDVQACWSLVDAGRNWACAVTLEGRLYCWGHNGYDQLGDGTRTNQEWPTPIGVVSTTWTAVSCGFNHTCGINALGELYCWGDNESGQLGDGTTIDKDTPNRVGALSDWSVVSANGHITSDSVDLHYTCAVRGAGELYCWGNNYFGQLGIGNNTDQRSPVQVGTEADWLRVSTGGRHACALKTDGRLFCWGRNSHGQLGQGFTSPDEDAPLQVGGDADWSDVSLGFEHSCALKSGGNLFCWGYNSDGQVGDGTTNSRSEPVSIGAGWSDVGAGNLHTCAVKTEGALYCWGRNSDCQCGQEASGSITGPTPVGVDTDWARVEGGGQFTCGLKSSDDLFCWGEGDDGQIGNGTYGLGTTVCVPSVVLIVD
jgi:cysteine-rich repeat protein